MTVTVEKPQIITLLYRQEKSDADYGSCLWARFYLDTQNYTMSIESDCGNYSYGWCPTPDSESFLRLLCRMNSDYLLYKLAERTVSNGDATWKDLKELLEEVAECEDIELDDVLLDELQGACYHQRSEGDVYDSVLDILKYTEFADKVEDYSIVQCIEMDYHPNAKKIVSVFLSCIVPVLREMEKEEA